MNPSHGTPLKQTSHTKAHRGQILVIFAGTLTVLLLMAALVVDLAWLWSNSLKIQRAADAAALAGVIHLPGDAPTAYLEARDGAARNGYPTGAAGVTVTPLQDVSAPRRLDVKVTAPVKTFFLTLIGMDTVLVSRKAKAEYILPVPMGSPENYYGVFGPLRTAVTTGVTGWVAPTATGTPNDWTTPNNAFTSNDVYATKATTINPNQVYRTFGLSDPGGATITGIEVEMESRSTDNSGCRLGIELSKNAGSSYTSTGRFAALTNTETAHLLPSSGASTDLWGTTWTWAQLNNTNFRARVQYQDPGASCTDLSTTRLDRIRIRVHYTVGGGPAPNLNDPYGAALTPRGFWGTFINQGAEKVNGDAYLPKWDPRTSGPNDQYDPVNYYNYALEMPTGATSGELWIFDAPFCATDTSGQYGTGDRWFSGSTAATSAFYTLYDTNNTLYDLTDDVIVSQSGSLFANQQAVDATLFDNTPPAVASCAQGATSNQADGRYWHNRWW
ncbi:MAG TPA: pilus assembly protein TadG-related protein, partial [Candidatus Dormibacteraeota bacterium]|nr:pilus assembly protein TadG-related protein [Candidatus Dormibacteraeota bacterium]